MSRTIEFIAKVSTSGYPYFAINIPTKVSDFYNLKQVYEDKKPIRVILEIP